MQNYYDILGVSRSATTEEIKAAYRRLAKQYHPDSSGSHEDKERFQEIQEAYMVLSNENKRKTYDYYGHEAYRSSYYAQHSADAHAHAHNHSHDGCGHGENCGGSCEHCGHYHTPQDAAETYKHVVRIGVWLEIEETFQEVIKDAWLTEQSSDSPSEKKWSFQVKIPEKTYEKQSFPLEEVIIGNEELIQYLADTYPNNCYVVVILLRDKPGYKRQAYHLYFDYMIDFHTLVLGGPIRISCVTGDFHFHVPAGTSLERKLRIPNMGLNYPPEIGNRGDLYLNLRLKIPASLTEAQKNALEALRDVMQ